MQSQRGINFHARIAEFLLLTRLKVRRQLKHPKQTPEIVARGSHIVVVTCKNWFLTADGKASQHRTPL